MRLLISNTFRTVIGLFITVTIPFLILCPLDSIFEPSADIYISILVVIVAHFLSSFSISSLLKFPGVQSGLFIGPTVLFWFVAITAIPVIFNFPFSVIYILIALFTSLLYRYSVFFLKRRYYKTKLAFIPLGRAINIDNIDFVQWTKLERPYSIDLSVQAIVVDLHSPDLDEQWQKFLADETLKGTPIYNVRQIEESLTGRVKIMHMCENDLGSLLPSNVYMFTKRIIDTLLIILSLPFTFLIGLVTAFAIKLDDGGSVFYTQDRVGHRGKIFKIYKFRSMKEKASTQTTVDGDDRITRVGQFIRKVRVDELPQFINVVKGDLSLIGPRAEYKAFADELEKEVPFFQYRHIVKPGISGWAQVEQGYATGGEETQIKIEYDFYYIKHFSFSLDVLIFLKTIRTIFTGFGAR